MGYAARPRFIGLARQLSHALTQATYRFAMLLICAAHFAG